MFKERAINLLNNTAKCPKMYATDKESFLMRVSTILEVIVPNFIVFDFYQNHIKFFGSKDEIDDLWAKEVINDALNIIKNI